MSRFDRGWAPYVPVAKRRANAEREMQKLSKKGVAACPVEPIKGRAIAKTFWGAGWCEHLEKFSDYENRLPRGRTYVRNGAVCHLEIEKGNIEAMVSGSALYKININIKPMPEGKWAYIRKRCTGKIGSLLQLLQGKFSDEVMTVVTDRDNGLFPLPGEMTFDCSCPDWADMCKHVAAVLYGVGVRLDQSPELLFKLRGVDHEELIDSDAITAVTNVATTVTTTGNRRRLKGNLSTVFGVEFEDAGQAEVPADAPIADSAKRKAKSERKLAPSVEAVSQSRTVRLSSLKRKRPVASSVCSSAPDPKSSQKSSSEGRRSKKSAITVKPSKVTGVMIRDLRKQLNLSAAELGAHLGVSTQTVYNWEKKEALEHLQEDIKAVLKRLSNSC